MLPMKRLSTLLALVAALCAAPAQAQTATPEAEVRAVIQRLFDAMRTSDSTAMRALFHPSVRLQSVGMTREGVAVVREDSIDGFIRSVGSAGHPVLDERIANVVVQVDGNLAQAWMNYTFYLGEQKSHCGVDAMQLFRGADGWKFIQLADTRRRADCPDLPRS
jgi:ABC-type phosphate/phosphonate transport system permease subunit